MKTGLVSGVMLFVAAPLIATPAFAQDAKPAAAKPAKERKICRSEHEVGTRFAKRTCMTAEQWREQDEASRRDRSIERAEHAAQPGS